MRVRFHFTVILLFRFIESSPTATTVPAMFFITFSNHFVTRRDPDLFQVISFGGQRVD